MGVVYSAYDPELDRKVALKLVHLGGSDDASHELARARLLHEAQATARLSHPNVVAVYEVGTVDDQVFLAMEYVKGEHLGAYAKPPRPWRDVLAAYRQAGAGLAAAHRAGVFHRDFKPENVLIDRDGRVRVVDFGLAATADAPDLQVRDVPLTASARGFDASVNTRLAAGLADLSPGTQSTMHQTGGTMVGTPAYMAPEQHLGAPADARADQFSFCAALYEGLYGQRPIPGATLGELRQNLMTGVHHNPPAGSPIPPWLRRVVLRGLCVDPEQRYPSMTELLADLARDPGQSRRRAILGAMITLAVLAALALGYASRRWQEGEQEASLAALRAQCVSVGATLLGDAWSEPRRASAERALKATGLAYAADTWTRVRARLDTYAKDLQDMSIETCTYAQIRGAAAVPGDPRMACLHRLAAELDGLTTALAAADARVAERAVQAAVALPPPSRCSETPAEIDDPEKAAAAHDLLLRLARARARAAAGNYADAAADAAAIADAAATLGERGIQADALLRRGGWLELGGDIKSAEPALTDAYYLAEQAARDDLRVEISIALASIVGIRLARVPDGLIWLRHAKAISERIDPGDELRVRLLSSESGLLRAQLDHDKAGAQIARAVALAERLYPGDDPRLGAVVLNLGVSAFDRGDYPEAERLYERALGILERSLGPRHPELAPTLNNLGSVHEKQGRFPAAVAALGRAMAIREASVGPNHPGVAVSLTNLGVLALRQRSFIVAEAHFSRAREIFEKALGKDHPNLASALGGLGRALVGQGHLAEARPLHTRAREILEKALGPDHPVVAFALLDLAELELASDNPAAALPLATRALELRKHGKPEEQAAAQYTLARALHASRSDPERITTLAASAELAYRAAGPGFQPELDEVIAWRATLTP